MKKSIKLFIVEGEDRDYRFTQEMINCFFKGKYDAKVIYLPAAQNLYMLFKKLSDDKFETDIVEVLRDTVDNARDNLAGINRQQIDEVFLFFDYDIHQDNTGKDLSLAMEIIETMLDVFNNETENGKLFISYPMVEALYDYLQGECITHTQCYIPIEEIGHYKTLSGKNNPNANRKMNINFWREVLQTFYLRVKCLFDFDYLDMKNYRSFVSPQTIFTNEKQQYFLHERVFVLSAFPEFLFDYFKEAFWKSMTRINQALPSNCIIKQK